MIRKGRLATRDTRRERRGRKTARREGEKQESTQSVTQIYLYIKKQNRTRSALALDHALIAELA